MLQVATCCGGVLTGQGRKRTGLHHNACAHAKRFGFGTKGRHFAFLPVTFCPH